MVEVWIKENRFHVRDKTGRHVCEILADIEQKSRLEFPPNYMVEMMDIDYRVRHSSAHEATELYGDVETNRALIQELGGEQLAAETTSLLPIATQILSDGSEQQLEQVATAIRLGRDCIEYHVFLKSNNSRYKTETAGIVSAPLVMYSSTRDPGNSDHYLIREIVKFDEGVVTDADVEQPVAEVSE